MNSGVRVSIPNSVRKTIHNIKEITGNHSEDEIYAMLKECSMDPNETAQKLLLQDPFHEVKRKRDRKKENSNKESLEPKWKPGMQGRGNRGGRGNYSSRHASHGGSKSVVSGKENEINKGVDDGSKKNKEASLVASASKVVANSPPDIAVGKTVIDTNQSEVTQTIANTKSEGGPLSKVDLDANKISKSTLGDEIVSSSRNISASKTSSPSPAVHLSASDPILMPSHDSRLPVGTIKREVGSQRTPVDQVQETTVEIKTASGAEVGSSFMQGKIGSEFEGEKSNLVSESSHFSSSIGRPPSNYNNRPQQAIGPQKVGKEWKPKVTTPIPIQGSGKCESADVAATVVESHVSLKPESTIPDSKDIVSEKEKKLEKSRIPDVRHVIIPNHLHVPEAEKLGFRFGSFDASFGLNSSSVVEKSPSISDDSEGINEHIEEHENEHERTSRNQDLLASGDDGDYPERPSSSSNVPENLSPEADVASNVAPDHIESKQETLIPTTGHQYPVVHPSSNLSFGFMPPIIGSHMAPFETNESQARDASRVPSFVVQQPFDPAGFYPQFYRSGGDSDGRISPFHPPKYNGNVGVISSQEVGNSLMLSAANPTPLVTQAPPGAMQNSVAVTQQPLPIFRQPPGLHLPHYPPNYIPYGPYFSPFYLPPPAIHQFLSNGGGSMYPSPPPKYPLPQYKPGNNNTNSGHVGPYGAYGSSGYNPNPPVTAANSGSNEDLAASQFKESNVYVTAQQSEGSGVWIAAPNREIPASFYNLPQGGQVAYTPTQTHAAFASIYHPPQPVTTHPLLPQDMVGPTSSVYQPPQPAQINWPNNY